MSNYKTPPNFIDLTGQRFGRLTVLSRCENIGPYTGWLCKCDCGNYTKTTMARLRTGTTRSCGCLVRDTNTKHNMHNKRPYGIWCNMKGRCENKNDDRYKDYGGRGIKICEKWHTFEGFWEDMKGGYADNLTLDRIDVDGDYCKDNCKWSTWKEQANNKRYHHLLTYNGITMNVAQWAEHLNINKSTLSKRLSRGWSAERALSEVI